ncbi:MAG: hypothetical protein LC750_00470 [Actinobacteria bacterium]|nr:hypothetical protein [Actinomycetota bacterium]
MERREAVFAPMTTEANAAPPADAGTPPAGAAAAPPPADAAPPAATKPEWLPDNFWDAKAGALNTDEFGKHYGEISATAKAAAERAGTVPDKPDGYKVELQLPKDVVVPEGVKFDPAKDPRLPAFLKFAHDNKLSNELVNAFVALDAQQALADIKSANEANVARAAEEDKKLGEKAKERRAAAWAWADGLKDKGFSPAQVNELRLTATSADGVTTIEKLMELLKGSVPGTVDTPAPKPDQKSHADRIWPGGFSSTPQARNG